MFKTFVIFTFRTRLVFKCVTLETLLFGRVFGD